MTSWERYYASRPRTHYVYRAFDAEGRALYVGCTIDPRRRFRDHRRGSDWWPYAVTFDIDSEPQPDGPAWASERAEIQRLRPAFNLGANHAHYAAREYLEAHADVA